MSGMEGNFTFPNDEGPYLLNIGPDDYLSVGSVPDKPWTMLS
jgi:hypothetical protein